MYIYIYIYIYIYSHLSSELTCEEYHMVAGVEFFNYFSTVGSLL